MYEFFNQKGMKAKFAFSTAEYAYMFQTKRNDFFIQHMMVIQDQAQILFKDVCI